jgi:hypothetical protein
MKPSVSSLVDLGYHVPLLNEFSVQNLTDPGEVYIYTCSYKSHGKYCQQEHHHLCVCLNRHDALFSVMKHDSDIRPVQQTFEVVKCYGAAGGVL